MTSTLLVRTLIAMTMLLALATLTRAQCSGVPAADWRTTITNREDPFFSNNFDGQPRWVKFTILLCDPTTVYFQNSITYPFHYDFARARLNPFLGATRENFESRTLHIAGQEAVLGAVLIPGPSLFGDTPVANEMAIQFVGLDAYPREQILAWFNTVKSKITSAAGVPTLYFPTFEQSGIAQSNAAWFQSQGVEVGSSLRWQSGGVCYAKGWAVGDLVFVPGTQVGNAYRTGLLRSTDILLTDGVPIDVPPLAGIITTTPATPNSHAAILSSTWGIPFALVSGQQAADVQALIGRQIIVRAKAIPNSSNCDVQILDADTLPADVLAYLLQLKQIPPLVYPAREQRNATTVNTDALVPADTKYVGGKAAHYGILRRAIPANVRPAIAITLDVWEEFLNQTVSTGRTLRQEIAFRLNGFTSPPADPAALSTALAGVRSLFTSTSATQFSPATSAAILAALQDPIYGFDPNVKIRFRSSSNVEDLGTFSGAGLYESFSGCLADELDADTVGPSICDPLEANERGVFRALRRVFASFYYDYAWEARRRLSVNEDTVGMAALCHHSFPDETEMANGVAVLRRVGTATEVQIVTQLGAVSVTNPPDGSIPEEVVVTRYSFGTFAELRTQSNMVVLGDHIMTWESDYVTLTNLLAQVADRYAAENAGARPALEFEFKKTTPNGALEIKQMRPLPVPAPGPARTVAVINTPVRWCLFQGETWNALAYHRLKMMLETTTDDRVLTPQSLASSFIAASSLGYQADCSIRSLSGRPDTWPSATWTIAGTELRVSWRIASVANPRTYTLIFPQFKSSVPSNEPPVVWLTDFALVNRSAITIRADYDQPVLSYDSLGQPVMTTRDQASLVPCPDPDGLPVHRTIADAGISIDTRFTWVPGGAAAGYTFDLADFDRTIITGVIPTPITLTGYFSQTYAPGHHNFNEDYIFDPWLDPGVPPIQRAELRRRNIAYIWVDDAGFDDRIYTRSGGCMPCPMDIDASGAVTPADIFDYLNRWFAMDPSTDWNGVSGVNVQDIFDFLNDWFTGCS